MEMLIDVIGYAGAIAILLAYGLISTGRLTAKDYSYHGINVFGAVGLTINSYYFGAMPNVWLNIAWTAIAAYAVYGIYKGK